MPDRPTPQLPVSEPPERTAPGSGRAFVLGGLGVLLLLLVWELAARRAGALVLARPHVTFLVLARLIGSAEFHQHFWVSLVRMLAAVAVGGAAGLCIGIVAGLWPSVRQLLEPFRWVAMSVPPAAVLVVLMLWLGTDTTMVVTTAAFLLAPIVYVNTVEGMRLVDERLEEMAHLYRFSLLTRIRHLYLPALAAPLSAAAIQVVSGAVRVVILAELLGSSEGIGSAIQSAGANLDIALLFAWVVLSVGFVAVAEYGVLRPLQRWFLRWRRTT